MIASRSKGQLLIIDCQDRLAPHISNHTQVIANAARLAACARRLGIPITLTEHYPKGLGHTVQAVSAAAGRQAARLEKIEFSGWRNDGLRTHLGDLRRVGRSEVVIAGMEAHVCVMQTVLDLVAADFDIFLVGDAVGSRRAVDCGVALKRARWDGAAIVTAEMIAFEWLERGGTPEFEELLPLFKDA